MLENGVPLTRDVQCKDECMFVEIRTLFSLSLPLAGARHDGLVYVSFLSGV